MRENVKKYIEESEKIDFLEDSEYEEACKKLNNFRNSEFSEEDWNELIKITPNQQAKIAWKKEKEKLEQVTGLLCSLRSSV